MRALELHVLRAQAERLVDNEIGDQRADPGERLGSAGWRVASSSAADLARSYGRPLDTAREELAAEAEFDVTIVNHEVHAAADELVALMVHPSVHPHPDGPTINNL